ncbi:MAG TPA: hypothetical protein DC031_01295 [Sulfitobacter sp.]|jgi:hypothetical protein|uniref:hypothetical protein n=1 Tax=Sulfitobacter dubius TaxID=218673 RepID=UPI000C69C82C|nr:hypothetical protein [Sulfitobacter sp.]HBB81922.1 hypothetical protein [Sulfitobacter sp.]
MTLRPSFKMVPPMAVTDAILQSSTIAEDDHPVWDAATTYASGARVILDHKIYLSNADSNLGNDPRNDTAQTWWTPQKATNRWKPFDTYLADQASQAESAEWVFAFGEVIDSLTLLNMAAATVQIAVTDPTAGEVYNQTYELDDNRGISDIYDYFFGPFQRAESLAVTDLPLYSDASITVTLADPGGTVALGQALFGQMEILGTAQEDLIFGYESFSRKEPDAFGRVAVVPRDSLDTLNVEFITPRENDTYVKSRLKARGDLPTVYMVDTQSGAGWHVVYGYVQSVTPSAQLGQVTKFATEIQGLV